MFQQIRKQGPRYDVRYGFVSFRGHRFVLKTSMLVSAVREAVREFGVKETEVDALESWYEHAQKQAIANAQSRMRAGRFIADSQRQLDRLLREVKADNDRIQQELERELSRLAEEVKTRQTTLFTQRGFKEQPDETFSVDVAAVVKRNGPRFKAVGAELQTMAVTKGYGIEDLIGAVTAMVQTALHYRIPKKRRGHVSAGFIPPPQAFVQGFGDCDTKGALVASILAQWRNARVVGVRVPRHYLLGVQQRPKRGDVHVQFEGLPYVLVEPSGPAWMKPGRVGQQTWTWIRLGRRVRLERLL